MRRAVLVGVGLALAVGTAGAGNTRKVDIESEPAGASVYLNDIDSGSVCAATPCTIDAPIGQTPIILRKDGYSPEISSLDVPKKSKLKPFKFTLTSAVATLIVDDPALKGGTIKVDDVDKGTAPAKLQIEATSHHIVVTVKGKVLYDDFQDAEAGGDVLVRANKAAATSTAAVDPEDGTPVEGDGSGSDTKVVAHAPDQARDRFINVGVAVDVGFRQFKYENPANLPATEDEAGQALVGPELEIWPVELLGGAHLRGLSLFGKVGFGVNHQVVTDLSNNPVGVSTLWGNIEADVRHTWRFSSNAVELGLGFVRDQMQYNADSKSDLDRVPVVDYKSLRVGVRAATTLGPLEPFAAIEGRIVLSAGDLQSRFDKADVTGGRAMAGATARFGPLFARIYGSIVYYSWTIVVNAPTAMEPYAKGATDMVEWFGIDLGLVH
jgi:hypothetical protein